ncbi:peptidase domain-containing ABC transporter [Cellvibrio sp. NN19]|uniref:peptidase domain-containing ABC transporter n=1 Tax=Cellvibrio chitinivorans TaxID=3102792 RepID=UPI002B405758|nr:peptidase domain-containing ABC transporter [Cellvibrio sp. NN19]
MEGSLDFRLFKGKTPVVLQGEEAECGLVCVAMILRHFGKDVKLKTLRKSFNCAGLGMSFDDIRSLANEHNMSGEILRLELDQLKRCTLPLILHWDMNHFVVLVEFKGDHFIINDPAIGKRSLHSEEFSKHFTGWCMDLKPTSGFQKHKQKLNIELKDILEISKGYWPSVKASLWLATLSQLFVLAFPLSYKIIVDSVVLNGYDDLLFVFVSFFAALALFHFLVSIQRSREEVYLGTNLILQTTTSISSHLFSLPISYFESRKPSAIVSRITATRSLERILSSRFIGTIVDAILSALILVFLYIYSPILSNIIVISILVYAIAAYFHCKKVSHLEREGVISSSDETTNLTETVQAIQTIKLYNLESQQIDSWKEKYTSSLNSNIDINNSKLVFKHFGDLVTNCTRLLLIYFAVSQMLQGLLTMGQFFAVFMYGGLLTMRAKDLVNAIVEYQMLFIRLERLNDILEEEPEYKNLDRPVKRKLDGKISLSNVSFRHQSNKSDLINTLSFDVDAGDFVVIVGKSGSGKTTLLKLILGLYTPRSGKVCYDGLDINKFSLSDFRKQVGTVMQEDFIMSGSIAKNICLDKSKLNYDAMVKACQIAEIDRDIESLPMKYETFVKPVGGVLSAGQRQRILLARAIYREPKILLIDEGASALDSETELKINKNLQSLKITRISIAHRLESIKYADKVFSMEEQKFMFINEYLAKHHAALDRTAREKDKQLANAQY